jgi:hypothetical protein
MKPSIVALLLCTTCLCGAQEPDPRAFGFSVVRMPDPKASPKHSIRSESTYSIVVYGDNYLRRKEPEKATHRIHGLDREFDLASLQKLLTDFYRDFPVGAEVADPRLGGLIPLPNIIYIPYGWNEPSHDGPKLVDTLSRQYGVGLFHCVQNAFVIDIKEPKREGVPTFDQACRDYYLSRLTSAANQKR